MATKVVMPKAGQTMEEGTIVTWLAIEGDEVKKGDVLFEVETDKAVLEQESPATGILRKILYQVGDVVPVLEPIAIIAAPDEDISSVLKEGETAKPETAAAHALEEKVREAPRKEAHAPREKIIATPAAKRAAREKGVDLKLVMGSGPAGRITEADIEKFLKERKSADGEEGEREETRIPFTPMRKAIAHNLVYSKQHIPHFYLTMEVNATALYEAYQTVKKKHKVSVNDFIIKAIAHALSSFPQINSRIEEDTQILRSEINIGIAVAVKEGLVIPVLVDADRMSLYEIADNVRTLVQKAREGKIAGTGKGTFTISNLGMYGIMEFAAVINPPETAVLAVGEVREDAIVKDGMVGIGRKMNMTLSGDHRAFDGATGAQFLSRVRELLENPSQLIVAGE